MARLILLLTLLLPTLAHADLWLVGSVTSYHSICPEGCYNRRNLGVGIEVDHDIHTRWVAGNYENSNYHNSFYAGLTHTPLVLGPLHFGLAFGVVNGYPDYHSGHFGLVVVPMVQLEGERLGANLFIGPNPGNGGYTAGLQLKFKL